jgi:hypothetical protein
MPERHRQALQSNATSSDDHRGRHRDLSGLDQSGREGWRNQCDFQQNAPRTRTCRALRASRQSAASRCPADFWPPDRAIGPARQRAYPTNSPYRMAPDNAGQGRLPPALYCTHRRAPRRPTTHSGGGWARDDLDIGHTVLSLLAPTRPPWVNQQQAFAHYRNASAGTCALSISDSLRRRSRHCCRKATLIDNAVTTSRP